MGLTKTQEAQLRTGGLAGVEFYDILKAAGYEGKELTETLAGLSVETLATQSAEQKFNDAISSLKETLVDLVGTGVMDKLVNGLSALAETLASGGSLYTLNPLGESDLTKNLNKKNDEYIVKQDKAIEDKIAAGTELNDAEKKRAVIIERNNKLLSEKGGSMGSYKDVITFNREFGVDKFDESLAAEEAKEEERMKKDRSFAKGGIVPSGYPNDTYRARLSSGEAVVPLDAFYSKLDTRISAVEQGGNIYLETDKVGTAHNKSIFKLNK